MTDDCSARVSDVELETWTLDDVDDENVLRLIATIRAERAENAQLRAAAILIGHDDNSSEEWEGVCFWSIPEPRILALYAALAATQEASDE